jgi:predicted HD phosphohydrolase
MNFAKKVLPLAIHEHAHFIDSTSTAWGLNHLNLMNQAYLCGNKEAEFHKAKRFSEHCIKLRLPRYYTLVENNVEPTRPWQAEITIGKTFDSKGHISHRPQLFVRFSNSIGQGLARSPISTISILEASAMAHEIHVGSLLISRTEGDFKIVEQKHYAEDILNYIYRQDITEYSACAHLVANKHACKDIMDTFELCANMARFSLNCSPKAFQKLHNRCPIGKILKIDERSDFTRRLKEGLKLCDLGVFFYLLNEAMPAESIGDNTRNILGIYAALSKMGLEADEFFRLRDQWTKQLAEELASSQFSSIKKLAEAGYSNLIKIDNGSNILSGNLSLPPVWLGDGSEWQIFNLNKNTLKEFSLDTCFDELFSHGQEWVRRFSEACI